MGRSGRGCTDVHPGDVGVYGIVDVLGNMLDASHVIHCENQGTPPLHNESHAWDLLLDGEYERRHERSLD